MLELRRISKSYVTSALTQVALDDVSVTFRDNEFVAILGASGSGKTTMLNVIGGLDHFDSGDLVIDGVSTAHYKDRDWDAYRNARVGFVFQSYNLIPHQSVVANVELALTLSGFRVGSDDAAPWPPWKLWVWRSTRTSGPPSCRVGRCSAWPLRVR